jgi:Protein of unknown function (DUF3365).
MKHSVKQSVFVLTLLLAVTLMIVGIGSFAAEKASESEDTAVERTRQQIKMLDDLYKTVVVLITKHYVKDPSTIPVAATASKALFAEMKKKGWHEVRILGLTEVLSNQENKPSDSFEQAAAKKLLAGETAYEEVVEKSGERYLRVATGIPVVMEKCIMCHANFKGNKGNIGALSYTVPMVE